MEKKATRQKINYGKIKKEYLTSNISICELAKKYKVNKSCISRTAQKEGWERQKIEMIDKATIKAAQATIDADYDVWEKTKARLIKLLEKKMDELEQGICDMSFGQVAKAAKDMRDMGVFGVTTAQLKAEAEIKKIEKEMLDDDSKDSEIKVTLSDELDEYAN